MRGWGWGWGREAPSVSPSACRWGRKREGPRGGGGGGCFPQPSRGGERARTSGARCWAGAAGPAPPHPVSSSPERRAGASSVSIRSVVIRPRAPGCGFPLRPPPPPPSTVCRQAPAGPGDGRVDDESRGGHRGFRGTSRPLGSFRERIRRIRGPRQVRPGGAGVGLSLSAGSARELLLLRSRGRERRPAASRGAAAGLFPGEEPLQGPWTGGSGRKARGLYTPLALHASTSTPWRPSAESLPARRTHGTA